MQKAGHFISISISFSTGSLLATGSVRELAGYAANQETTLESYLLRG